MESSDSQEEVDERRSEPLKSNNSLAIPDTPPVPTPEVLDSDRSSATPPQYAPTPESIDLDKSSAIPPAALSTIAVIAELGGDVEVNNRTASVTTAPSDGETLSVHSNKQTIDPQGSAHTSSTEKTPGKNEDAKQQELHAEALVANNEQTKSPEPEFQMPNVAVPAITTVLKKDPPSELREISETEACKSNEIGTYGQTLHDTLAILVDKHDTVAKMQKDVELAQTHLAGAYERVVQVHHALEEAQKRVVVAQEDLVKGLREQLKALQASQAQVGSKPSRCYCNMA